MFGKLIALPIALVFVVPLMAQHGTAPNGYYPVGYSGDTFTGVFEATKGDPQQLTLVYTKGTKTERFVGRFESPCGVKAKDGTVHTFNPTEAREGTVIMAYYKAVTKKVEGQKTTENLVLAISFAEVNGKRIPEEQRLIIACSEQKFGRFTGFR